MEDVGAKYSGPIREGVFAPRPDDISLEVGVVGAGIAGLAAAIGLRKAGHEVEIFERSKFKNEVGAAIAVCPNAARICRYWGFDFTKAEGVISKKTDILKGDSLETVIETELPDFVQKYGDEQWYFHRVDLHNELRRIAEEPDGKTRPAKITLSAEVADVDADTGIIEFVDGTEHKKDLIVAADGVHSKLASRVCGYENPAMFAGRTAYRFLVPTHKLADCPKAKSLLEGREGLHFAFLPDRSFVWYPVRGGKIQNMAFFVEGHQTDTGLEDWKATASLDELRKIGESFHPSVKAALNQVDEAKVWPLLYRKPLSTWVKGRLCLSGDAVHSMLPFQGQGGAQAIEDGAALGAVLSHMTSVNQLPKQLHLYQEVRQKRAAIIQIYSSAPPEQIPKLEAEAQRYTKQPVPKNLAEFIEYTYSYDVLRDCMRVLADSANGESK